MTGWEIYAIEPVGILNQFRQSLSDHESRVLA